MKEIGARTTLFELDGSGTDRKKYLHWLLAQVTASRTKIDILSTDAAAAMLCERLTTPLQFAALPDARVRGSVRSGQKPVDADTMAASLASDLDGLEARLTRNGYNAKVLTEVLGTKAHGTRAFLGGQFAPLLSSRPDNRGFGQPGPA